MSTAALLAGAAKPFVMTRTWTALVSLAVLILLAFVIHVVIQGTAPQNNVPQTTSDEAIAFRRRGIKSLVMGSDGRASTSKMQAVMWTAVLFYVLVFLLVWGRSNGCDGEALQAPICREAADGRGTFDDVTNRGLQAEIYVLLGLPLVAALTAKALTTDKVSDGTLTKPELEPGKRGVISGLAEVMSNDKGQADLVDFQYFGFNLLALAFFLIEFLTHPLGGLPTIPRTLLALSGLSAGTYTAKKALEKDPDVAEPLPTRAASQPEPKVPTPRPLKAKTTRRR